MKKKIAFVLALICALSTLALTACTDDEDKQRVLDDVEQSIVGTWKSDLDTIFTFNSDGTYAVNGNTSPRQIFRHEGYGVVDGQRYEIIDYSSATKWALFDNDPDNLHMIDSDGTVYRDPYLARQ